VAYSTRDFRRRRLYNHKLWLMSFKSSFPKVSSWRMISQRLNIRRRLTSVLRTVGCTRRDLNWAPRRVSYFFASPLHRWFVQAQLGTAITAAAIRENNLIGFVMQVIRLFSPTNLSKDCSIFNDHRKRSFRTSSCSIQIWSVPVDSTKERFLRKLRTRNF
jgi:hypothetical protein